MSYKRYDDFYKFNNRDDFVEFVEDCRTLFSSTEEWEGFFGFELKFDEDTGEDLETVKEYADRKSFYEEPTSYPAIAFCAIDSTMSRFGVDKIRVFEWVNEKRFNEADEDTSTEEYNHNFPSISNPYDEEIGEDFREAIYTFVSNSIKNKKEYPYIYTILHKSIDRYLFEYEIETTLPNIQ